MLLRSVLAAAGALGLSAILACSTDQGSSPDGGSYGHLPDSTSPTIDGGATDAPTCKPADVSTFKADTYHAARPQPNSCTPTQIDRFYAACLAPSTSSTTCGVFIGADASSTDQLCAACIISRQSDPTYGPIIEHPGWQEINVAGCLEISNPSAISCAKSYQAAQECEDQACKDNCAVNPGDPSSFGNYQACTNLAASVGCENFAGPAACVTQAATGTICQTGGTFQEEFTSFALLFCGPHDGGAPPPADGGAHDGSVDAPAGG